MDITRFSDFRESCQHVVKALHRQLSFDLWMVTRKAGRSWVLLSIENHGYNVHEGTQYLWADSFCAALVDGLGPPVAPRAQDVPIYAGAGINQQLTIGAYFGVPLHNADGSVFGTLCAIDPKPQPDAISAALPMVEMYSQLLGKILALEIAGVERSQQLTIAEQQASTDTLTALLNRRGWEHAITHEESRAQRYGGSLSIFVVDLDNLKRTNDSIGHSAGDALLRKTADCLRDNLRKSDVIARTGGDEFAVLALDCDETAATVLNQKIKMSLSKRLINASVGHASRGTQSDILTTIDRADRQMYEEKAKRKLHEPVQ